MVLMDRWALDIRRNDEIPSFQYDEQPGTEDVSVCVCVCVCVCVHNVFIYVCVFLHVYVAECIVDVVFIVV